MVPQMFSKFWALKTIGPCAPPASYLDGAVLLGPPVLEHDLQGALRTGFIFSRVCKVRVVSLAFGIGSLPLAKVLMWNCFFLVAKVGNAAPRCWFWT